MNTLKFTLYFICVGLIASCSTESGSSEATTSSEPAYGQESGQASVSDDVSMKNLVQVAQGSPDHTTLVAAVLAAEYQNVLVNAGPFTVWAPTNAAFEALPEGTVETLLKPENIGALQNILKYHVSVPAYTIKRLKDGQKLGQAQNDNITITIAEDGTIMVNGTAKVIATVEASNGIIHIIDAVLLPPEK